MNQIATTIEQSKKLIELGIDVYTADMFWKNGVSDKYIQCFTPFVNSGTNIDYDYDIPAWSLSALIELVPIKIRNSKQFTIYKGESGYSLTYFFHDEDYPIIRDGVTLLDTAFEMVCYLLENKLI